MRNLPFIIVASLLALLMLAAALWSRNYGLGSLRTVQFGTDLTITTRLADPVAVILSVENQSGIVTPFAWAALGDVEGTMRTSAITFPPSPATGTIFVQFASGMQVFPNGTPLISPSNDPHDLNAGPGDASTAMAQIPGFNVTLNGAVRVPITPGTTPTVEIHANGATINGTATARLPPGPPPPPPPPSTGAMPASTPTSGG